MLKASRSVPLTFPQLPPSFINRVITLLTPTGLVVKYLFIPERLHAGYPLA